MNRRSPAGDRIDRATVCELAALLYKLRQRRARVFGPAAELFADPAWDVILELFAADGEGRCVSSKSACLATGASQSTGWRYLDRLMETGVMEHYGIAHDRRSKGITLTPFALDAMTLLLRDFHNDVQQLKIEAKNAQD